MARPSLPRINRKDNRENPPHRPVPSPFWPAATPEPGQGVMIVREGPVRPFFSTEEILEKLLEAVRHPLGGAGHSAEDGCATGVN